MNELRKVELAGRSMVPAITTSRALVAVDFPAGTKLVVHIGEGVNESATPDVTIGTAAGQTNYAQIELLAG